MQGTILFIDDEIGEGIIRADDGTRYRFATGDMLGGPRASGTASVGASGAANVGVRVEANVGARVDFELAGDRATELCVIGGVNGGVPVTAALMQPPAQGNTVARGWDLAKAMVGIAMYAVLLPRALDIGMVAGAAFAVGGAVALVAVVRGWNPIRQPMSDIGDGVRDAITPVRRGRGMLTPVPPPTPTPTTLRMADCADCADCTDCGMPVVSEQRFCTQCGAAVVRA